MTKEQVWERARHHLPGPGRHGDRIAPRAGGRGLVGTRNGRFQGHSSPQQAPSSVSPLLHTRLSVTLPPPHAEHAPAHEAEGLGTRTALTLGDGKGEAEARFIHRQSGKADLTSSPHAGTCVTSVTGPEWFQNHHSCYVAKQGNRTQLGPSAGPCSNADDTPALDSAPVTARSPWAGAPEAASSMCDSLQKGMSLSQHPNSM